MFTGLVQESARITDIRPGERSARISIESSLSHASGWELGASICVNGVCLTVVVNEAGLGATRHLCFDVSPETLTCTNLGTLRAGDRVHLEPSLTLSAPLGGHLVSGHVDGVGRLSAVENTEEYRTLEFEVSGDARARIAPYLVPKGSIAVDGVSLTVNTVADESAHTRFRVMLIPHTLELTRFGALRVGNTVNLEADLVAKYVQRNFEFRSKWNG